MEWSITFRFFHVLSVIFSPDLLELMLKVWKFLNCWLWFIDQLSILPWAISDLPKSFIPYWDRYLSCWNSRTFDWIGCGDRCLWFCTFQIFGYKNFPPDSILLFAEMPDKLGSQTPQQMLENNPPIQKCNS
jgi:hypothetical protein